MTRAVLTVALGSERYIRQALGLAQSLSLVGDPSVRIVISDSTDPRLYTWFDLVVLANPKVPTYIQKLQGLEMTDVDELLFIDSDSIVFERLDKIWRTCEGCSVAVQGEWIEDGEWYGELADTLPKLGLSRLPMFNGGMIYYQRSAETAMIFSEVQKVAASYDETGLNRFRGAVPDEPCLAVALARSGKGTLLPDNLDFMNTPVGVVGRITMNVLTGECFFIKHGRHGLRFIRPTILHAGKYVNNFVYWRQLSLLERLAK